MNEAQVKSEAKVRGIVREYRDIKSTRDMTEAQLKRYRGMLKNLLPVLDGKWQDADGYARIEEYKETYSYDKARVDKLMDDLGAFATKHESDDVVEILYSLIAELRNCRKPRKGYTTVKVK